MFLEQLFNMILFSSLITKVNSSFISLVVIYLPDIFFIYCIFFLILLYIFKPYKLLNLLIVLLLILFMTLLFFLNIYFKNLFFFVEDNILIFNDLITYNQTIKLKILIIFISFIFFLMKFYEVYFNNPFAKFNGLLINGKRLSTTLKVSYLNNIIITQIFIQTISIFSILLLISSSTFLTAYLSLELFSLCSSVLIACGLNLNAKSVFRSNNLLLSLNYLLISTLGSCLFLLGVAYLYGHLQSFNFEILRLTLPVYIKSCNDYNRYFSFLMAVLFIFVGLLIKGGFAPFYFWIFEIYSQLSYFILSYFLIFSKTFVILFLYKLVDLLFIDLIISFFFILIAIINMFIGTLLIINQNNLKKILIGSSLNNSGYILLFIAFPSFYSFNNLLIFLYIYLLTMLAIFFILIAVQSNFTILNSVSSFKLLNKSNKYIFIILLLSLLGLPFLSGFWAKFLLLLMYLNVEKLNYYGCNFFFFGYTNVFGFLILILNSIALLYYINMIFGLLYNHISHKTKLKFIMDFKAFLLVNVFYQKIFFLLNNNNCYHYFYNIKYKNNNFFYKNKLYQYVFLYFCLFINLSVIMFLF